MADELSDRRPVLSAAQRALLEKRVRDAARATDSPMIPARSDPSRPAPLSSPQRRLWVLDQLVPGSSWYNVTRLFRVEGPLDPDLLKRALSAVVSRHASLRTAFPSPAGQPMQVVSSSASSSLVRLSVEGVPVEDAETRALALAREDAERPFDLERGPLFRAALYRLAPDRHILHFTVHHIVTDGWS
ncbi:MAG: condensation domain-containing protein, partial [Acidobacteriota bacterium]